MYTPEMAASRHLERCYLRMAAVARADTMAEAADPVEVEPIHQHIREVETAAQETTAAEAEAANMAKVETAAHMVAAEEAAAKATPEPEATAAHMAAVEVADHLPIPRQYQEALAGYHPAETAAAVNQETAAAEQIR